VRVSRRRWRHPLAALVAAGVTGLALLGLVVALGRDTEPKRNPIGRRAPFDVLYRPPTFVSRDRPTELRYEIVCPLTGPPKPGFCRPSGALHVRRVGEREFDEIPLTTVRESLATVSIPAAYSAGSGFEYYVDLHDERGRSTTVPGGGAAAPQRSWAIDHWTPVALGRHRFGKTRPGRVLVEASWGAGARRVGLRRGVGPSSFAVVRDEVIVLDQVNRRLAVYRLAAASRPRHVPIRFLGGEGDLAVAADGTAYVLDAGAPKEHVAFVRSYTAGLRPLAETRVAEAPSDRLSIGPDGALVHGFPSEQWLPVGEGRQLLGREEQERGARPARTFPDGRQVIVKATPFEARLALFDRNGVAGSWRLTSVTRLGEVQLAEQYGRGLVVILRLHAARRAEWQVLELTPDGTNGRFSVRPVERAAAGAGARFRLAGRYLYQLRSGRSGIQIARYDLSTR
jgi:hypothetical protein